MRNEQLVKIVVWVVVIGMVLAVGASLVGALL
jgi:hypothetical protein